MRLAVLIVPIVLPLAVGCSGGGDRPNARGSRAAADQRPSYFAVPKQQLPQLNVVRVQAASWPLEIHTTGTVDWDADHTTQVIAQASGPISRIVVDLGQRVKAGQPLLYLASPDLANAISAFRKAENRLDLARRTVDRNRDLLAHRVIAQKDLESSEADYNDAFTEVQNDLDALAIFGVDRTEILEAQRQNAPIRAELPLRSPIDGVVVQKQVLPGQLVQSGSTPCFMISNTSTVWVQGHLRDSEIGSVRAGDPSEVRSQAAPQPFHGKVSYVGAILDPATRTTPVRVTTPNPGGLLKKDQFVDVVIRTATRQNVLTIPTSAVLYTEDSFPFVYRQVEPGRFARVVVRLGAQRPAEFEVLSGLAAGDSIVSQGALFLQFAETLEQ